MFRKTGGIVVLIGLLGLSVFLLNCGSSSSRPAGVLFVTSQGASSVESFSINLGNGDLSQLNTSAPTGSAPSTIFLDPTGAVAYVLNTGDSSITTYKTNADGSLSKSGTTALPSATAVSMARDAAGKFLFIVTQGNEVAPELLLYAIQPGSTDLTAVGAPLALTRIPDSIAAITVPITNPPNPTAQQTLLYVTSIKDLVANNDNTLSEYAVDASGNVTEQTGGGSPLTTAPGPASVLPVLTAANNLYVYVDSNNTGAGSVSSFQVCTTVSTICTSQDVQNLRITPTSLAATSVGLQPGQMITGARNPNFLYLVNSGSSTVSSFRVNPTTGALAASSPATVSTGSTPVALAEHPNGEFLYVANSGSGGGEGSVSGFTVNTNDGSLSGGVQVSSSGAQPAGLVAK